MKKLILAALWLLSFAPLPAEEPFPWPDCYPNCKEELSLSALPAK